MYQIIIKTKDGRKIKHEAKVFKIHNYTDAKNLIQIELSEDESIFNLHCKNFTYMKEDIKSIKVKGVKNDKRDNR